mmetsp:Transcript_51511/g.159764  ORF Transcript_51511/g.159764 Transcript_51511/m.159764 type:complete len:215 (+) Transcript_51511:542-1186(+)
MDKGRRLSTRAATCSCCLRVAALFKDSRWTVATKRPGLLSWHSAKSKDRPMIVGNSSNPNWGLKSRRTSIRHPYGATLCGEMSYTSQSAAFPRRTSAKPGRTSCKHATSGAAAKSSFMSACCRKEAKNWSNHTFHVSTLNLELDRSAKAAAAALASDSKESCGQAASCFRSSVGGRLVSCLDCGALVAAPAAPEALDFELSDPIGVKAVAGAQG